MLTGAELEFLRTSLSSVVNGQYIRFTMPLLISFYQKMVSLLCKKIMQCTRMEGSHHVNWNSIIYRKGAIHRTEIERPLLAAKRFNTNLVQFLTPYCVTISNMHVCCFMCMISHVHRCVPKTVLQVRNVVHKKFNLWRPVIYPPSILKQSPRYIEKKDSETSLRKDIFDESLKSYPDPLKDPGFNMWCSKKQQYQWKQLKTTMENGLIQSSFF